MACHDVAGRTCAARGVGGPAELAFASAADLPGAAVLCALPALIVNGLFHAIEQRFPQSLGYYPRSTLFILFAFMSLARVKTLEKIRYELPGVWGRILGLDRIPEVKTLRNKLESLAKDGETMEWSEDMSTFWMNMNESLAGVLYVDGHIRAYTGDQTDMPKRYSSRNRLCMPSLMDYWINDSNGTPFFVVAAMGNEGMQHYLKTVIVPRLMREVPGQPTDEELAADPDLHRFVLVFDREGWSPAFFAWLWRTYRIAALTYRRGATDAWPTSAFTACEVPCAYGNTTSMKLAERIVEHPDCAATPTEPAVQLREVRRLCERIQEPIPNVQETTPNVPVAATANPDTPVAIRPEMVAKSCAREPHQTVMVTTVRQWVMIRIASQMFTRWSQENYFKYGTREFNIDHSPGHKLGAAPSEQSLLHPTYKILTAQIKKSLAEIKGKQADLSRLTLASASEKDVREFIARRDPLDKHIKELTEAREKLLAERRGTDKRIKLADIPDKERPQFLAPARMQFLNTIHIVAYRAETVLANELRHHLGKKDEARALLQDLFKHDADLIVDEAAKTLTVRIHHFANPQASRAIAALLETLNQTETIYPGTEMTLRYEMVSNPSPSGQEV